jgi:DNA-binding transcriptional ArsR family regulator
MALPQLHSLDSPVELDRMVENAREASEFLKALAQESRLLILCILAEGERSVGELEEFLAQRQSTVSQQLARLRLERLVTTRREGKTVYYSLASDKARTILDAIYDVFCTQEAAREG